MLNYNIRWRTGSHSCRRFQSDMLDPEARLHIGGYILHSSGRVGRNTPEIDLDLVYLHACPNFLLYDFVNLYVNQNWASHYRTREKQEIPALQMQQHKQTRREIPCFSDGYLMF